MIVWLTGNSGAGKTTLARRLVDGSGFVMLDGDEMRASISLGAGFTKREREEHNLRVARLAKVLDKQGHNIVVSVIAPFRSTRKKITRIIPDCRWVYIKKLQPMKKDRPYQPPKNVPVIDTGVYTKSECYEKLMNVVL